LKEKWKYKAKAKGRMKDELGVVWDKETTLFYFTAEHASA